MKSTPASANPYSRENLLTLDHETLIDMVIGFEARFQQLADHTRDLINEKYGQKSERFETPGQLLLFSATNSSESSSISDSEETEVPNKNKKKEQKKKQGHGRNAPPPDLPRIPVFAQKPKDCELPCSCCGNDMIPVRWILQGSRYQFVPASFYFEDLYSVEYGCPNGNSTQKLLAKCPEVVENGRAAPGLLAQVAIARDFDHIPFNRQSQIYKRSGVNLSRSTLSDFYAQVATILLPLYTLMHQILLQSRIISTDDTPVKVLDRSKEKNIKRGRKWIYIGDQNHPVNLFDYTHDRGRDGPLTFLKGFNGFLQGDCFSGNLAVCASIGTTLVACLAHARRYFIKSLLNDKQGSDHALTIFQSLYEIERAAKDLEIPHDELTRMREEEAVPILNAFSEWMQKKYAITPPKSSFGKALFYCINNWNELTQYVKDGELKIDNNHSEREMKYVAMGRKAWLFFGSDKGGKDHAIVMSILSTCRRHGVEPWAYLTDVIQRLTENPACDLEELLPYNWKQRYPITPASEITVVKDAPKSLCA